MSYQHHRRRQRHPFAVSPVCFARALKKLSCRRETARCLTSVIEYFAESLKVIENSTNRKLAMVFDSHSIATTALFCIISEIKRYFSRKSRFFIPSVMHYSYLCYDLRSLRVIKSGANQHSV